MPDRRREFLAGDRPDDVAIFLSSSVIDDPAALTDHGTLVEDGVVVVVDGERGRSAFESATGVAPMRFAQDATEPATRVSRDLTGGECPADDGEDGAHRARVVFAFVEAENPEAGGIYAEGDVVHAYAECACGERYSDRWVAGE